MIVATVCFDNWTRRASECRRCGVCELEILLLVVTAHGATSFAPSRVVLTTRRWGLVAVAEFEYNILQWRLRESHPMSSSPLATRRGELHTQLLLLRQAVDVSESVFGTRNLHPAKSAVGAGLHKRSCSPKMLACACLLVLGFACREPHFQILIASHG